MEAPVIINRYELLRDAIMAARENGYRICDGDPGIAWSEKDQRWRVLKRANKAIDPLAAIVLHRQPKPNEWYSIPAAAAEALRVDLTFIAGVTHSYHTGCNLEDEPSRLGLMLREERW